MQEPKIHIIYGPMNKEIECPYTKSLRKALTIHFPYLERSQLEKRLAEELEQRNWNRLCTSDCSGRYSLSC